MTDTVPIKVWHPTDPVKKVTTITSNEDHVGSLIYEGSVPKEEYYMELTRLYKDQLAAKHRELVATRDKLLDEIERLRAGLQTIYDVWVCRADYFYYPADEEGRNYAMRAKSYLEGFDPRWGHQEAEAWRESRGVAPQE